MWTNTEAVSVFHQDIEVFINISIDIDIFFQNNFLLEGEEKRSTLSQISKYA